MAALADETPTPEEATHLAACAVCAAERQAFQRVAELATGEGTRIAPPLTDWDSLSAQLRTEGLIRDTSTRHRFGATARWGQRAAAALILLVGGAAAGRYSALGSLTPAGADVTDSTSTAQSVAPRMIATPVANSGDGFKSTNEAIAAMAAAQAEYQRAASYLLAQDSTPHRGNASRIYRNRLAALDELAQVSRQALLEAPQDPVMNQYYLSTVGAREVTLRQLGTALPVGTRLASY